MRQKATRASTTTTLVLGAVRAEVSLMKTTGDPEKVPVFEKAGPNGGRLVREQRLVPAAPAVRFDPISGEGSVAAVAAEPDVVFDFEAGPEYETVLVEEGSGVVIPEGGEVARGVRREDGSFVDLTDHLARIEEATKLDEMGVAAFIRVEQVPRERVIGSYYIGTDGPAAKVIRLLFEAMRESRRVAVVKLTKRTRQSLGVIVPHGASGALLLLELAWDAQWRDPGPRALAHLEADVTTSEVKAALALVGALSDSREALLEQEDDAVRLRRDLVEAALSGDVPALPEGVPGSFVGDGATGSQREGSALHGWDESPTRDKHF